MTIENDAIGRPRGLLLVVSGPSAVGKDTILTKLLANPKGSSVPLRRCVTATTREPRDGEIDGVDYYFHTIPDFHAIAQTEGFLEYANVFGNWYGTPREWVAEQREKGIDVILKIDVQGAASIKQRVPDSLLVFFRPPSIEELERRIRSRATESEEQIARRLLDARHEMAQMFRFDYCIVNREVNEAVSDLKAILQAEHCRISHPILPYR